jgi:glucan phosphoethanolaminetransferase (alkaline phosphatase superfamily)
MIQRIQTVYLALALILVGLWGWLPMAEIASGIDVYRFSITGITNVDTGKVIVEAWPLFVLMLIIELIQFLIIFMYKNRIRQIRMATFNILLMIGIVGAAWFFMNSSMKELDNAISVYKVTMAFPLVAAILNYLAIRAIGKDEALIRSIDRIR